MRHLPLLPLGLALLIGIGGFFALPGGCLACACASWDGPAAARERSTVVFQGRVVAITEERLRSGYANQRVTLRVGRTWKGMATSELTLYTGMGYGDCGYPFQVGTEHLIYASQANNSYYPADALLTSTCGGTSHSSRRATISRYLGAALR